MFRLSWRALLLSFLLAVTAQAANLHVTGISLGNGTPEEGELLYGRINYTTTSLAANASYTINFQLDGVSRPHTVTSGAGLASGSWVYTIGGWMLTPGQHTLQITLDSAGTVAETDETDNTLTYTFTTVTTSSLPQKFRWPLPAQRASQYAVGNYLDVDPLSGTYLNFAGQSLTYDGHNGWDIVPPDFTYTDAGLPVYAAAAGTVTTVQDGNYDRQIALNSAPANYVAITHGAGWVTYYYHLLQNSTCVTAGQAVAAGQLIGFMGSSGNSTDAHLHFSVEHNGWLVEPFANISKYFQAPLPVYQPDQPSYIQSAGITNYEPVSDAKERASECDLFPVGQTWSARIFYRISSLNAGDQLKIRWYRPSGTLHTEYSYTAAGVEARSYHRWSLGSGSWSAFPGVWQVAVVKGATELVRKSFTVVSSGGAPEIRLRDSTARLIPSGRTTPLDFGSMAKGGAAPQQIITIENHGAATLSLTGVKLPPGFSLASALTASVAAGSSATFTLQLDTAVAGPKFGAVEISSNDTDEPVTWFNAGGTVTGAAPTGTPVLALGGAAATAYQVGAARVAIAPLASLSDSDSTQFGGGSLGVSFAAGGIAGDQLNVRSDGNGAGQVGVAGSVVRFGGVQIGTLQTGTVTQPLLVVFNASATVAAVQAVSRNVTFANFANSSTAPRYIRFAVTDETAKVSLAAVKPIVSDIGTPPNHLPAVAVGQNTVTVAEGQTASLSGTFADADGNATVTLTAERNGTVVGSFTTSAANGTWTWQAAASSPTESGPIRVVATDAYSDVGTSTFQLNVTNVAPAIPPLPPAVIGHGTPFTRTVAFNDPGANTWSATADYGDGSGPQPVTVDQVQKQLLLNHTYAGVGNYTVTLSLNDNFSGFTTSNFPLSAVTAVEGWRHQYFGTTSATGNAADLADPDLDGLPNIVEFAYGLRPDRSSPRSAFPAPIRSGDLVTVTFDQPAGVEGILYGAEWSPTLSPGDWHAVTDTGAGAHHIFSVDATGHPQLFLRYIISR